MSDGVTRDRLATLRSRWESDPTSRIFLQLAEEHRHLGQVQEALGVLDRGLQEHPGYLSALVAKGRCHLELGEPEIARPVLERVVKQDPTQMVANKLLVRAYLDTGALERARERLDLYNLLNDSDPEIEVLHRRITAMNRPAEPLPPAPAEDADLPPAAVFADPLATAPRDTPLDGTDPFGLAPPPAAPETPPVHRPDSIPALLAPELPLTLSAGPFGEVFPGLHLEQTNDRYLLGLSAEGIFPLPVPIRAPQAETVPGQDTIVPTAELSPAPPMPAPPTSPSTPDPFDLGPMPDRRVSFAPEPLAPLATPRMVPVVEAEPFAEPFLPAEPLPETHWISEPLAQPEPEAYLPPEPLVQQTDALQRSDLAAEAFAEEETISELLPVPAPELEPTTPLATVTLADLYVGQGYPAEAERLYREVLERDPDNQAARNGLDRLARLERRYRPLAARDLLFDYQETVADDDSDVPRVRHLLQSYLQRIRERSPHDVS